VLGGGGWLRRTGGAILRAKEKENKFPALHVRGLHPVITRERHTSERVCSTLLLELLCQYAKKE
jgi:hypothetical protein